MKKRNETKRYDAKGAQRRARGRAWMIASLSLTLHFGVAACGDGASDEPEGSDGDEQDTASSKTTKSFTGKGPAKSPAGRPLAAICGTTFDGCDEYFSADPEFGIARNVGGWCTARSERCPSEDIAGTCLYTKTTSFGESYDVIEVVVEDRSKIFENGCAEDGGTWTPGPTR